MTRTGPPRTGHRLFLTAWPAALLACGLLAGCAVNEKKEIAKYRAVLDADAGGPVRYTPGEPLHLETALRLANAHNQDLQLQGETYLQALIDKDRAVASFLPTISLAPSYAKADSGTDSNNARSGSDIGDPTNPNDQAGPSRVVTATGDGRFDTPLNARWSLFNGFRDVATYRARLSEAERQRLLLLDLQATVLLDVAQVYYTILRAERSVQVLRNSVAVQEERVRDARARVRVGLARPLDVAQFEAQAAATRVTLIDAQRDVRNSRTMLAYLIDARVQDAALFDGLDVPTQPPAVDPLLDGALAHREDLRAAVAEVQAAQQNVQAAIGQYYPTITLNFNYYLSRETNPTDSLWNGLVSANLPIFTAGLIHNNVRFALSRLRQALINVDAAKQQVEQDVLIAYENFRSSGARESELQVQYGAAGEALRLAEGRGEVGQGTNLDRLIAQDQVLTAELRLAGEQFDRKLSYLSLLRAAGRLGLDPQRDIIQNLTPPVPTTQPVADAAK